MQVDKSRGFSQTNEPVHLQAELPMGGTPLNPLGEEWVFTEENSAGQADLTGE